MKKILFIDDDAMALKVGELMLSNAAYTVITANSGEEGFKQLQAHKVDAIFLDLMMPVMNGIEFLKVLRSNEDFKTIPVVVQTGVGDTTDINEALKLGISSLIRKPYNRGSLLSIVKLVLDGRRSKKST